MQDILEDMITASGDLRVFDGTLVKSPIYHGFFNVHNNRAIELPPVQYPFFVVNSPKENEKNFTMIDQFGLANFNLVEKNEFFRRYIKEYIPGLSFTSACKQPIKFVLIDSPTLETVHGVWETENNVDSGKLFAYNLSQHNSPDILAVASYHNMVYSLTQQLGAGILNGLRSNS